VISLHLKLPGDMSLEDAHDVAERVERSIVSSVPGVDAVQTHLEPLGEEGAGTRPDARSVAVDEETVRRIVRETTDAELRELRFLHTHEGLVAFLTLGLDPYSPLAEAHARASAIEERIRRERPEITEAIVHTEP
jgi:divalent metal cation (Fe/Co/Zn/Cd) transporter